MADYYFIVNPISGRGSGALALPELERLSREHKLDFGIAATEQPGHAIDLARQAALAGHRVVVSVGGDGTANEVLNGLMQARRAGDKTAAMGVISVGRGNDFAYGVGVPPGLLAGFQALLNGVRHPLDVGLVTGGLYPQGRYFGNGVGIGFDAVVGFEALKLTHLQGFTSYIVAALKTIFLYFKAPHVELVFDDTSITLPALMVSIMNGRRMGGGFMMAPHAQTDDGLLNLCIARQVSKLGVILLIPRFMNGSQATHPAIQTAQARRVSVRALQGVLPAHADGETLCVDGKDLSLEILPGGLDIVSPVV